MNLKRFRTRRRLLRGAVVAAALMAIAGIPWSDSNAQSGPAYSVDFHVINAGGTRLHNSCFVLNGTTGQATPGYSSGGFYSVLAGFWSAAPVVNQDQLFFDGFEGC
jgi:hypothetical protein